ncbi:MAG: hydantoinase/oxoprolinase family protein, partial [Rubrobacteraceae bacterium]
LQDGAELGGEVALDRKLAEESLRRVGDAASMDVEDTALGVLQVANTEMVRALRVISVEKGLDPREFALVAFGGAGPLHACALAEELGMTTVLVPRASGVLSALGLAVSDVRRDYVAPLLSSLDGVKQSRLEDAFEEMEQTAAGHLGEPAYTRRADLRYAGQSFELTVEAEDLDALEDGFHGIHERRYGYRMDEETVELVNLRLIATLPVDKPELDEREPEGDAETGRREVNFDGDWVEAPVLDREKMGKGSEVEGPAVVEFAESTCVVRPGWGGKIDGVGTLILERGDE